VNRSLREALARFPDGLPLLDPIEDMKITEASFLDTVRRVESLEEQLLRHPLHSSPELSTEYSAYSRRLALDEKAKQLSGKIRAASLDQGMVSQLKRMKRVLRRLGLATAEDVITMKGRYGGRGLGRGGESLCAPPWHCLFYLSLFFFFCSYVCLFVCTRLFVFAQLTQLIR